MGPQGHHNVLDKTDAPNAQVRNLKTDLSSIVSSVYCVALGKF